MEKSTNNKFRKVFMKYTPYTLDDVNKASAQNKFNVISTFAGGGGSSTGYKLAGGNVLAVNEFVPTAQETYKENYPDTPILPDDIKKLSGQEFLDITGLKAYFKERDGMERMFNGLTYAIRNGSSVRKFLNDSNLIKDKELKPIAAIGFADVASFLKDMLKLNENAEMRKDYNACLQAVKILKEV